MIRFDPRALIVLLLAQAYAVPARADGPEQEMEEVDDQAQLAASLAAASISNRKAGKGADILAVPLPITNPTLGTGIVAAGVAFYNPNAAPSPWITGGAAMKTSQGNWMLAALHSMSLNDNQIRLNMALGTGKLVMRYYGIGEDAGDRGASVQLDERFTALRLHGQFRVARALYAGARMLMIKVDATPRDDTPDYPDLIPPENERYATQVLFGPSLSYDTRDDSLNPGRGIYAHAEWMFGIHALGGDFATHKLTASASYYRPGGARTTWALHASFCAASDAPYYSQCLFGQHSDLRGYASGRYRDGSSWTLQAEWRRRLSGRWGMVAFAGIGGIAPEGARFYDSNFLPSGGAGMRFRPSRKTNINLRLDFAVGRSSQGLYLGIAEAF